MLIKNFLIIKSSEVRELFNSVGVPVPVCLKLSSLV